MDLLEIDTLIHKFIKQNFEKVEIKLIKWY